MSRNLTEAVNIENAVHLGTAHGYDVFDILTYEAAQQFTIEDREHQAGAAYTQNESTFNANINDSQHLYFFARENTNQVYGAVVKGNETHSDVTFVGQNNSSITVRCNFLFENAGENSSKTYYNKPLPFFWIPGAAFDGQHPDMDDCIYIEDGVIAAALIQFADAGEGEHLALDNIPQNVTSIAADAFNYGVEVDVIKLDDHIEALPAHCMDKVHNHIFVTMLDAPFHWDPAWNSGKQNITEYGYGLDPELVAEREREIAAAQEAERLRQEEEERRQAEEERRRAEREARKLRYKVKGKEVIITGTISGINELEIPEEIEGKPVTTIAAYAFFEEEDLRRVTLPRSLKKIEQGAFYGTGISSITIPRSCIVGKYNNNIKIRYM